MKNCEDNSAKYRAGPSAGQTSNPYLSLLFKTDDQGFLIMQPGTFMIQKLYNKIPYIFAIKSFLDCMNCSLVQISSLLHMFRWHVLLENKWSCSLVQSVFVNNLNLLYFSLRCILCCQILAGTLFRIAAPPIWEAARLIN